MSGGLLWAIVGIITAFYTGAKWGGARERFRLMRNEVNAAMRSADPAKDQP